MRPLVPQLLARGHEPFVLSRSHTAAQLFSSAAHVAVGDLDDPASLQAASRNMDAVVFMLPAFLAKPENALSYAAAAANAAAAAGARLLVWNTSGRYPLPGERATGGGDFIKAMHEAITGAGIATTVIAPAKYMENLLGPWTVQRIAQGRIAYPVLPERKMGWIACQDVCALLATALEKPHLAGRIFRVSGLEAVTGPQLAAIFSAVLGGHFAYQTLTPQQMKDSLEAAFGAGAGDEVAAEYALDQQDPQPPTTHYDMSTVLAELPAAMTSLRAWIQQQRAVFDAARATS
jgi:uncharacterized protein YbjT (DUF2867 family)